jgi:hypothetical protein
MISFASSFLNTIKVNFVFNSKNPKQKIYQRMREKTNDATLATAVVSSQIYSS